MKTIKDHIKDENKIMTDYYETNYDYKLLKYNNHINNEPLKIFKKRHKKWEEEKEVLLNDINNSFIILNNSYKNIEDYIKEYI